ncbi:MAG: hypothetical protein AB1847_23140 [bacterium]
MNDFLCISIGIIVLANFLYTLWSYFSLKKMTNKTTSFESNDHIILENIIHSRSSLNLVYASIAIIVFVLSFFGFNIQKNITAEVKREITEASKVDLEVLKSKSDSIIQIHSQATQSYSEISKYKDQARAIAENMKLSPQKLYVIEALPINKNKFSYLFSELQTVDKTMLPKFSQPPMLLWYAYDPDDRSSSYATTVEATAKGIAVHNYGESYVIDLWIYVR